MTRKPLFNPITVEKRRQTQHDLVVMWLRNQYENERNFNLFEHSGVAAGLSWKRAMVEFSQRLHQQKVILKALARVLTFPRLQKKEIKQDIRQLFN